MDIFFPDIRFPSLERSVSTESKQFRVRNSMIRKEWRNSGRTEIKGTHYGLRWHLLYFSEIRLHTINSAYLAFVLLYLCMRLTPNFELDQCRRRRDLLWPGITWNGMLKYVHRSKYSPRVSWLELLLISALLCLAVSFGICSHFEWKEKKKKAEREGRGVN